jgi:hypothetical protein
MPRQEELVRVEFFAARESRKTTDGDSFAKGLGDEGCVKDDRVPGQSISR